MVRLPFHVMIKADLHSHTRYSHGEDSPEAMFETAQSKGLKFFGFTEHAPRPLGYNYRREYRERLDRHLNDYLNQVSTLRRESASNPGKCQALLALEMDWFAPEMDFMQRTAALADFDYLIGSVHFLDHWGFDDSASDWENLSQQECGNYYRQYFENWSEMINSGMFQIAAHPDLIKIFSIDRFHEWLNTPENVEIVRSALMDLKKAGMTMEISSAGLRKPCREIYPHPVFCKIAFELGIPISFASDAHKAADVAYGFDELADYARSFGFGAHAVFKNRVITLLPF